MLAFAFSLPHAGVGTVRKGLSISGLGVVLRDQNWLLSLCLFCVIASFGLLAHVGFCCTMLTGWEERFRNDIRLCYVKD